MSEANDPVHPETDPLETIYIPDKRAHLKGKRQVQMYTLKPWPNEVRTSFKLPADPYDKSLSEDQLREVAAYLRKMGVFFYRDHHNGEAVLVQPNDADTTPITERQGFLAYKQSCLLEDGTLEVAGWDNPSQKIVRKYGDDRGWMHFNQSVHIVELDAHTVKTG